MFARNVGNHPMREGFIYTAVEAWITQSLGHHQLPTSIGGSKSSALSTASLCFGVLRFVVGTEARSMSTGNPAWNEITLIITPTNALI